MFPRKKRDLVLQQQHQAQGASPQRARDQSEEPDQPISLQWQFEAVRDIKI
nr:unnamed protein product [Callosobruchus analis]